MFSVSHEDAYRYICKKVLPSLHFLIVCLFIFVMFLSTYYFRGKIFVRVVGVNRVLKHWGTFSSSIVLHSPSISCFFFKRSTLKTYFVFTKHALIHPQEVLIFKIHDFCSHQLFRILRFYFSYRISPSVLKIVINITRN